MNDECGCLRKGNLTVSALPVWLLKNVTYLDLIVSCQKVMEKSLERIWHAVPIPGR